MITRAMWRKIRISLSIILSVLVILLPLRVYSLPQGEQVVEGQVNFDRSTPGVLNVESLSDKSIINYESFNIASSEAVNFYQPSQTSVALNRVLGKQYSDISGSLNANGIIYLINPNGIKINAGANLNAAAIIASTLDISNENFLSGNLSFEKIESMAGAQILNKGKISVKNGGYIALLSSAVENQGMIVAQLGRIVLAAGEKTILNLDDRGDISVVIEEGVKSAVQGLDGEKLDSAVKNSGTISANGGAVLLTAKVLNSAFDYAINNSGIIEALSLVEHDGVVELYGEGAPVINTGTIAAGAVEITVKDNDFINEGEIVAESIVNDSDNVNVNDNEVSNVDDGKVTIAAVNVVQDGEIFATESVDIVTYNRMETLIETREAEVERMFFEGDSTLAAGELESNNREHAHLIQSYKVKISARQFGNIFKPLIIKANSLYLQRNEGDIAVMESRGIGSSIMLRGPPDGFGAIIYNKSANLTLISSNGNISTGASSAINANNLSLIAEKGIYSYGYIKAENILTLYAKGGIVSLGSLEATYLIETGESFEVGGTYKVGLARVSNADNAINLNTGNYSGETADIADIIFNTNATITLIGNTIFRADSDLNGAGMFTMKSRSSIVGGGFNLDIYASEGSTLRAISGPGALALHRSQTNSTPTYAMNNAFTTTDLTVDSGVTLSSSTLLLTVSGNLVLNGTVSGTGGVTMSGTTKTLDGTGSITNTGIFTLSGGAKAVNATANLAFSGTIAVATGITVTNNGVVTTTAAGGITGGAASSTWVNAANSTLNIAGPLLATGTLTASASGNTVNYNGARAQNIKSATYNSLTLGGGGNKTAGGILTVNGNLIISGTAVFVYGAFAHSFLGNWVINSGAAAPLVATAGSTINFNTPGTPAATSLTGTTTAALPFVTININNTSGFSTTENMSASGTWTVASGVTFTPDAASIISGAGTLTGNGIVKVTRTAATADFSSQYTINNKTLTNLTVEYSGAAAQTVSAISYNNLKISNASGASLAGSTIVTGDLTLASGALSAGSNSLTIGGNWVVTAGSFSAGSGTVTFNDNSKTSTISGSNNFNNLTSTIAGKTINWVSGTTQTVSGVLTLTGALGNLITLARSGGSGLDQWNINVTGSSSVSYVSVSNSNATGNTIATNFSTNGGNNMNWSFGGVAYLKITGTGTMDAGGSQVVTITAYGSGDTVETSYTGDKNIIFSGAAATGAFNPTARDKNSSDIDFGSTTILTFASGVATSTMKLYKAESAHIDVTDGSVGSSGLSARGLDVTVSPAVASKFVITGSATQIAGASNSIIVTAKDAYGNVVSSGANNYTGVKSLTFSGASASANGDNPTVEGTALGSATNITFTNGVASSLSLLLYNSTETQPRSISATATGVTTLTALSVTVSPAVANNLVFTVQPSNANEGENISPEIMVKVRDAYYNVRTNDNVTSVSMVIENNPGSAVLLGTATKTVSSGIVSFNNLSLSKAGTGYTLRASSGALAYAISGTFNIAATIAPPTPEPTPTPAPIPEVTHLTVIAPVTISSVMIERPYLPDVVQLSVMRITFSNAQGQAYFYHPLNAEELIIFEEMEQRRKAR